MALKNRVARGSAPQMVRARGTVTLIDPLFEYFVLQDETGGMRVRPATPIEGRLLGHKVEAEGQTARQNEPDALAGATVKDLGPGVHPDPQPLSLTRGGLEILDGQLVSVAGIPLDSRVDALGRRSIVVRVIESGDEAVCRLTVIRDFRGDESNIVDAQVQFTAVLSATTDLHGKISGFGLISNSLDSLQILQRPLRLEALAPSSISALMNAALAQPHRVKLRGRIERDKASGELALADRTGKIPLTNADQLMTDDEEAIGSGVQDFAGFVSSRQGRVVLDYPRMLIQSQGSKTDPGSAASAIEKEME